MHEAYVGKARQKWLVWLAVSACAAGPLWGAGAAEPESGGETPPTFYATATVSERPLDAATAAVTVVEREEIERLGAATAADVLRFLPGVSVTGTGTRGGLSTAEIRGGDPNFTLVLVDGVPVNDGTYQVGEVFNLEALPAALIERLEVVRGPFSSFYGSTGLSGVVHIRTRRGGRGERGETTAVVGEGGRLGFHQTAAGDLRSGSWFAGGSWERAGAAVGRESYALRQGIASLDRALGVGGRLRLSSRLASWDAGDYPEASGGPRLGDGALRRSEHGEASLGLELAAGLHTVTAALYRHDLERASPAVSPLVPASREDSRYSHLRLGWDWRREPRPGLQLGLGLEVASEAGDNRTLLLLPDFLGGAAAASYDLRRTTPAARAEALLERGRWVVELGARVDDPEGLDAEWSPRLGVSWRSAARAAEGKGGEWRWRAAWGRAFKLPSFFATASPALLGGNPALRPEVMTGGDLGFTWTGATFEGGLGVFEHRYRYLVDFDFGRFLHVNRARVEARGTEAHARWKPEPAGRFSLTANLTRQDVTDRDTGAKLRNRPEWSGGLRLDWRASPRLALHLDGWRRSERLDEALPVPERRSVAGATVLGAGARWRLGPRWRVAARVDNLTNHGYEERIGFPGPGRTVSLGLHRLWQRGAEEP